MQQRLQAVFGSLKWMTLKTPKVQMQGTTISMKYAIAAFSDMEAAMKACAELESWVWDEATADPSAPSRPHHLKVRQLQAEDDAAAAARESVKKERVETERVKKAGGLHAKVRATPPGASSSASSSFTPALAALRPAPPQKPAASQNHGGG